MMSLQKNTPLEDEIEPPARREAQRQVRPMERADLQAVGRLFNKAFRQKDEAPSTDLVDYLDRVFLRVPGYRPDYGSIVHGETQAGGHVDSALLSLPLTFHACGREITARVLCAFMADGRAGFAGAGRLTRTIRLSQPELCFTDNAAPVSADHWLAAGSALLPVQSLEWRRVFRPATAGFDLLRKRKAFARRLSLGPVLRAADRQIRNSVKSFEPPWPKGAIPDDADLKEFAPIAEKMTERFAIRPTWSRQEVDWLMQTAALNTTLGQLRFRTVMNAKHVVIGGYLFFGKPGAAAHILNILCLEGKELEVVGTMFADLDHSGYASAQGRMQPSLSNALMRQRHMNFKYNGYLCLLTHRQDVREAAIRHDIYIGGLASEAWSRLLTDF